MPFPKGIDGSVSHFSLRVFELGENLFDRIEVRAVGRQKALRRPGGFANAGDFKSAAFNASDGQ